jgi:transposase-like protein
MTENYKINDKNHCDKCPECGHNWFKADLIDTLTGNYRTREQAIRYAKEHHNWSEEKPINISNLNFIELSDGDIQANGVDGYYQCESCQFAWHSETGDRTDRYKVTVAPTADMDVLLTRLKEQKEAKEAKKLLDRRVRDIDDRTELI